MAERITDKFDLESLRRTAKQLNKIQIWATSQHDEDRDLYKVIDGLCRVAHMYNMVITQEARDRNVITAEPQDYIDSKISYPYHIYKERSKEETY